MKTYRSIFTILFALTFVSCQSAPQNPISSATQPRPADSGMPPAGIFCASPGAEAVPPSAPGMNQAGEVTKSVSIGSTKPPKKVVSIKPVTAPVETGLISPSGQQVPLGAPVTPAGEKQRIVLNFEKADVAEVTNQIFTDQLKINYVMDQTLQGRVSMYIEGDYDNEELLQMVTKAYEANGISIIPKKGFYYIQSSQKAGAGLPMATESLLGKDKASRPLIVIYRLRYMDQKQATTLITPFLTPGRKVIAEPYTNTLIFIEDTDNARSIVSLLKTIDINILKEISMEIVPLYTVAPQDTIQGMETLMTKLGGFKDSAIKNSLALMPLNNFGGRARHGPEPRTAQVCQAMDRGTGCARGR